MFEEIENEPAHVTERRQKIETAVKAICDVVNPMGLKHDLFIQRMSIQHSTLEQSFTRLCFAWIEHCASGEYKYDGRNQATHEISKQLIEAFQKTNDNYKPSQFLPLV